MNFKHPVVDPVYNTRDSNTILLELAYRLGVGPAANSIINAVFQMPPNISWFRPSNTNGTR
jgi:hypothetical protein